jgi:hypothetical protein
MVRTFCFSSTQLTVLVECDEQNLIVKTAPVTQSFMGQHIKQLADWMRKQGGFEYTELKRLSETTQRVPNASPAISDHRRHL